MKKLAMLSTMLPFVVLADVAPMSRGEWERHRQFERPISIDVPSTSPAGYALAVLMGICLSAVLRAECLHRGNARRNFLSKARVEWMILTTFILAGCLGAEALFCPCSTFLAMVNGKIFKHQQKEQSLSGDETYEQYLFYQKRCRKCGTALIYDCGRRCPECHPRSVSIGQ